LEFLGIIPARGGSKGIPRKNLQPLAGKPLVVWTIEAALRSQLLTRTVVSTDDDEIAAIARQAGAEVIMRPPELAQDTSPTEPVLLHVLDELQAQEGYIPDAVVLLQCTCPLRGASVIDQGIQMWLDTGCDVVMSVAPLQHYNLRGEIDPQGRFQPEYDYNSRPRSQDVPDKFSENGALFVTRTSILRKLGNRLGGDVRALVMDWVHSVDIDTPEDLELAEKLIKALGAPE